MKFRKSKKTNINRLNPTNSYQSNFPISNQGKQMGFSTFVRKPFIVEAIQVTTENIGELAELVGVLREKDNGTPYIQVDRRLVPNIYRVYPGFWMTKMGDNIRCYSKRIFMDQFIEATEEIENWVQFMNGDEYKASMTTSSGVS
jgi:uncharacterized protein with HEPN domain